MKYLKNVVFQTSNAFLESNLRDFADIVLYGFDWIDISKSQDMKQEICKCLDSSIIPINFCIIVDSTKNESRNIIKAFPNNIIDIAPINLDVSGICSWVAKEINWIFSRNGKEKRMDNVFVIGDPHFFHKNIISYCNRPYANVDEMNEDLIRKWNSVVSNDDTIWINGDFAFGNKTKAQSIVPRLNGKKNLVLGNHDRFSIKDYYDMGFNRVYDHPTIINEFIVISHQPLQWVKDGGVFLNIYAHVHTQEMYKDYTANSFCSSAERIGYTPIRLTDILSKCQSYEGNVNDN